MSDAPTGQPAADPWQLPAPRPRAEQPPDPAAEPAPDRTATPGPLPARDDARGRQARRALLVDGLLLALTLALTLPLIVGAVHGMTREQIFWSSQGPVAPPRVIDGMLLLHPARAPLPATAQEARARAERRAAELGLVAGPLQPGGLDDAPSLVRLRDGGALLLLERRAGLCRVEDPRRGAGVFSTEGLAALASGQIQPLTVEGADDER